MRTAPDLFDFDGFYFSLAPLPAKAKARRASSPLTALRAQQAARIARTSGLLAARGGLRAARAFGFTCDLRSDLARSLDCAEYTAPVSAVENDARGTAVTGNAHPAPADCGLIHELRDALIEKRALAHVALSPRIYVSPAAVRATRAE